MKLRAFQKWPQNSFIFRIFGYRALLSVGKISNLDAAKKETLFQRTVVTESTGKRAATWPWFECLKNLAFFTFFFS